MFEVNRHPSVRDIRSFGTAMLIGFGVIGAIVWLLAWRGGETAGLFSWTGSGAQIASIGLWFVGIALFALTRFAPGPARPVYVVWMTTANAIGVVMSTVLLTLLFVLILPWFSLIVRWGDPLRKRSLRQGSYWEDYKRHEATVERMGRQF